MTSERAQAYGRVVTMLDELSASKLLAREQERIREAADTMLFCDDGSATQARAAHDDIEALVRHLVESDRWTEERAQLLLDQVDACGPGIHASV